MLPGIWYEPFRLGGGEDSFGAEALDAVDAPFALSFGALDIVRLDFWESQRLRHHGKRLGARGLFAGHVALWNRAFLDAEDWLASVAIQDKKLAGLGSDANGRDGLTGALDVEKNRRRSDIVVPQIVMHGLKAPDELTGLGKATRESTQRLSPARSPP
jgi:hypothetical protein